MTILVTREELMKFYVFSIIGRSLSEKDKFIQLFLLDILLFSFCFLLTQGLNWFLDFWKYIVLYIFIFYPLSMFFITFVICFTKFLSDKKLCWIIKKKIIKITIQISLFIIFIFTPCYTLSVFHACKVLLMHTMFIAHTKCSSCTQGARLNKVAILCKL